MTKRVCDFIYAHENLIHITTFGEYRVVMLKVMRVIKEAHNSDGKRKQTSRKKKIDETTVRTQRAKALISRMKSGGMTKDDVKRRLDEIFGSGSGDEIQKGDNNGEDCREN